MILDENLFEIKEARGSKEGIKRGPYNKEKSKSKEDLYDELQDRLEKEFYFPGVAKDGDLKVDLIMKDENKAELKGKKPARLIASSISKYRDIKDEKELDTAKKIAKEMGFKTELDKTKRVPTLIIKLEESLNEKKSNRLTYHEFVDYLDSIDNGYTGFAKVTGNKGSGYRYTLSNKLTREQHDYLAQYDNVDFGIAQYRYAPEIKYDTVILLDRMSKTSPMKEDYDEDFFYTYEAIRHGEPDPNRKYSGDFEDENEAVELAKDDGYDEVVRYTYDFISDNFDDYWGIPPRRTDTIWTKESGYLNEDIVKTSKGKWVNKGKEGTHGEFTTKKKAREQQKAIFASGWKGESLEESADRVSIESDFEDITNMSDAKERLKKYDIDLIKKDNRNYILRKNGKEYTFYVLDNPNEVKKDLVKTVHKLIESISRDYSSEYQLLDRLRSDCDYYLGVGGRSNKNLWAGSPEGQIAKMKELWNELPEKPEWLSMEDIKTYEKEMIGDDKVQSGNAGKMIDTKKTENGAKRLIDDLAGKNVTTGLSMDEIEKMKNAIYYKYYGDKLRIPGNLNKPWSDEDKKKMNELDFRDWVNSCLVYGETWKLKSEELEHSDILKEYNIDISKALEIIEEQKVRFKKANVKHDVYTDSEGVSYNSVTWDAQENLKENIGSDIAEYQKWVDYDMKKYGRISSLTNHKVRKAGLKIVKDKYGDYEVIASEPIREDIEMDSTTPDKSKINFNINDNGDFTFTINGKEYKGHTDKPEDMSKDLKDFGFSLTEDVEVVDKNQTEIDKKVGLGNLLNDLINDENEAINGYNSAIVNFELEGKSDLTDVFRDIIKDEQNHIGNLQKVLNEINPTTIANLEQGQQEAADTLNK